MRPVTVPLIGTVDGRRKTTGSAWEVDVSRSGQPAAVRRAHRPNRARCARRKICRRRAGSWTWARFD